MDVIVVGAGMAGLAAATSLTQAGHHVTVVDKAKGVGGRMATRRLDGAVFDHGAQFFTVRAAAFRELLDAHPSSFTSWTDGIPSNQGLVPEDKRYPRYRGVRGMTDVAKALAASGLDCRLNYAVTRVDLNEKRWTVYAEGQDSLAADAIILTAPVPQSLALVAPLPLPADLSERLRQVSYEPCFALMAVLASPSNMPAPGAMRLASATLAFLADNQRKGISPLPALTVHATGAFTRQYFDTPHADVARLMLAEAARYVQFELKSYTLHRWRYATPELKDTALFAADGSLVFAGDAFAGGRVEGAALSGLAAARYLLQNPFF